MFISWRPIVWIVIATWLMAHSATWFGLSLIAVGMKGMRARRLT